MLVNDLAPTAIVLKRRELAISIPSWQLLSYEQIDKLHTRNSAYIVGDAKCVVLVVFVQV